LPGPQIVVEPGGEADPYVWAATPDDGGDEVVTGRRRERVRRGRGRRGRGTERGGAEVDVAETGQDVPAFEAAEPEVAAEAPIESAPEPIAEAQTSEATSVEAAVAPVVEPEPQPEPEPDPNEITTPPATPRRGWWRRGG
jgi:ribonuclease E